MLSLEDSLRIRCPKSATNPMRKPFLSNLISNQKCQFNHSNPDIPQTRDHLMERTSGKVKMQGKIFWKLKNEKNKTNEQSHLALYGFCT